MNLFEKTNYLLGEDLNEGVKRDSPINPASEKTGSTKKEGAEGATPERKKETNTRGFNEPTDKVAPSLNSKTTKSRSFDHALFTASLGQLVEPDSLTYNGKVYPKVGYSIGKGDDEKEVISYGEKMGKLEDKTSSENAKEARDAASTLSKMKEALKEQSKFHVPVEHIIALFGYNLRAYGAYHLSGAPENINLLEKPAVKTDLRLMIVHDLFSDKRNNLLKDPVGVNDGRVVANYGLIWRLIKDDEFIKERFDRFDGMVEILNTKAAEEQNAGTDTKRIINIIADALNSKNLDAETIKELIGDVEGADRPELIAPEVSLRFKPKPKTSPDKGSKAADQPYTEYDKTHNDGRQKFWEALNRNEFAGISIVPGKYGTSEKTAKRLKKVNEIEIPFDRNEAAENFKIAAENKDIACEFIVSRIEEMHVYKRKGSQSSLVINAKLKDPLDGGAKTIKGLIFIPLGANGALPASGPTGAFLKNVFSIIPTNEQMRGLWDEKETNVTVPPSMYKLNTSNKPSKGLTFKLDFTAKQFAHTNVDGGVTTKDRSFSTSYIEIV